MVIWAVQNDFFDSIDVADIVKAKDSLRDYAESRCEGLISKIREQKKLSDELIEELRAITDWKNTFEA